MNGLELNAKALLIAKNIKNNYVEMFDVLLEMEHQQTWLGFGIVDMRSYCIEILELSPQLAKDFNVVVKKSIEVPALANAIRSRKTTISKARKVCPVMTSDNAWEWIGLTSECTSRVVEKCVAMASPREAVYESMTYVSGDVLEFKLAVSEKWEALLKQTKDLMSQKQQRAVTSEEAIQELMQNFCDKQDPVKKAARALARPTKAKRESDRLTRYRMAHIDHEVNRRDQGQCVHIKPDGTRCEAKRWLQKHHIIEFANGGKHTPENLITLCGAHHKMRHLHADIAWRSTVQSHLH